MEIASDSEDETELQQNLLEVKVIEAKDVIAADRGGTSDPYAVVDFRGIRKQTRVIKKSLTPHWNETFQFEIGKPAGVMVIDVFDHDVSLFGKHDFLGQVEVNLSNLAVEAIFQEWLELQPREGKLEIVSGSIHLYICIMPKDKSVEDRTGLDAFPWLDRSLYGAKSGVRTTNVIRVYFASTFADFQEEFKALHDQVFPKLEVACQSQGYCFVPVVLRYGLDERLDFMYMNDTRICPIVFREIAECRRISPRANFFAFMGDRYGSQFLPISLDKNEYMALCGSLMEDDEDDMALLALYQKWYKLDDNQTPSRFLLQHVVDGVSASAGLGTDLHNEWLRVDKLMFDGLKSITQKVLTPNRLWKYKVSLFEQEITLGALLPEDSADHVTCVMRTISNLRVVNVNAAKFVDIIGRRGDSTTDKDLKEVRPDMIDEEKRSMNKDLKLRVVEKIGARAIQVMSQWQGWTNGTDHIRDLCQLIYEKLVSVFISEMTKFPRHGFLREDVLLHRRAQFYNQKVLKGNSKKADMPAGKLPDFDSIRKYLNTNSDGTLVPLIVRGPPGSGMTSLLSLTSSWCKEKMLPGAVTVHRQCGLSPDSTNGCMLLWSLVKQLTISYTADRKSKLQLDLKIVQACDLPAADRGGTSDPFVQVSVARHKVRTKTVKKTLNPEWNEKYEMKDVVLTDTVRITIWDYDVIGKNDLLGQVEIPLSKIELNTPFEKWYAVPMELAAEKEPPVFIYFDVKVIAAKNLRPRSFRMDVDPFVRLTLGTFTVQTKHRDDAQDPEYNEDFELTLEDTDDQVLKCSVWDKGDDKSYEDGLLGEGTFELNVIDVEATFEGWIDLKCDGQDAGSVHFMATRHSETLDIEEEKITEGPRILLQMTLTPMPANIDRALDKTPLDIPCMYLPLADRFQQTLLLASASKPMNIVLDGFDSISSSDPITTMRWLPERLPRYVHVIIGFRDVDCKSLDVVLGRDSPPRIVKIKLQDPETCRENLTAALTAKNPRRTLSNNQRSSLLSSFTAKTIAAGPGQVLEIASVIPSYDSPIPVSKQDTAFIEIIRARSSFVLNHKVDAYKLWQAMDYIALAPLGISEQELKELMGGGTHGLLPSICYGEIMTVLSPLLRERLVDGHLVTQFRYDWYNEIVIALRFQTPGEENKIRGQILSRMQNLPDFNAGGKIDKRRLRCIPLLLKTFGNDKMEQLDEFLTDMHVLEMRLCENMIFDVLLDLIEHGPGIGGRAGDLLGLLEEYGVLLNERPRMMLQISLNMPDHTGVYVQGRHLEMRRRRGHFYALDQAKGSHEQQKMTIEAKLKRRQSFRLASMGDRDLVLGHPDAIDWRRARSWLKWLNKPQTRGQCKKVIKGHRGATYGASYICNGLVILSVSADRSIKAFSPFTGEVLKDIGEHPQGIVILELSHDLRWLATGSEEGTVIIWEMDRGPPSSAGSQGNVVQSDGTEFHDRQQEMSEGSVGDPRASRRKQAFSSYYPEKKLQVKAFSKRITGIAFTTGDTIVISADETDVKIFEILGDGKTELNSFTPFRYNVTSIAMTPPDTPTQMIAVAGRSAVRLYRYETLDFRGGLYGHERTVNDVKFCSKGKEHLLAATVSNDMVLKVWQQAGAREWEAICNLEGHTDCIRSVAWAPDDSSILTGSVDHTVKVWALEVPSHELQRKVFKLLATFDGHGDTVTNVRFHPQGSLAITCSRDHEVRVYDTRVPFRAVEPATHSQPIVAVTAARAADEEGREMVASVDTAGFVKIWDVQTGEPVFLWSIDSQHSWPITGVAFTNSGRYLITASKDGSIKRWDLNRVAEDSTLDQLTENARKRLEDKRKELKVQDNPVKMKAHQGGVAVLMMHHQGEFFLTSGLNDPQITIWDAETMIDVQSFQTPKDATTLHATFSNDGKFVISADSSNKFRLWNIEGNKEVFSSVLDSTDVMQSVDFSSDGRFIATVAVEAEVINIWDASIGLKLKGSLQGHSAAVIKTSFSHDGRYMCSLSHDKTLHLWVLQDCQETRRGAYIFFKLCFPSHSILRRKTLLLNRESRAQIRVMPFIEISSRTSKGPCLTR